MRPLAVIVLLALAGCGADGEPISPSRGETVGNGVTVSGQAWFGVQTQLN